MQKQVKVLIGDDTAEYGVSCASVLRSQGMYAYTRPKNGWFAYDGDRFKFVDILCDCFKRDKSTAKVIEE